MSFTLFPDMFLLINFHLIFFSKYPDAFKGPSTIQVSLRSEKSEEGFQDYQDYNAIKGWRLNRKVVKMTYLRIVTR